jgi:hypothetical protein
VEKRFLKLVARHAPFIGAALTLRNGVITIARSP